MLSLCNDGRELDRGETLRLMTNRKLGFTGEERQTEGDTETEDKREARLHR